MYVSALSGCNAAHGGQKRALEPLELELQRIVSHHVDGYWEPNSGLCKTSQHS